MNGFVFNYKFNRFIYFCITLWWKCQTVLLVFHIMMVYSRNNVRKMIIYTLNNTWVPCRETLDLVKHDVLVGVMSENVVFHICLVSVVTWPPHLFYRFHSFPQPVKFPHLCDHPPAFQLRLVVSPPSCVRLHVICVSLCSVPVCPILWSQRTYTLVIHVLSR